jgi:Tfp pilus assembly protein PilF
MHPDLLNNSLFLRYYSQWQKDPDSIVFASIADYFLRYGMIDSAFKVCKEGLRRHPKLTVGRVVMAKIQLARGNFEEAEEEVRTALQIAPKGQQIEDLMARIDQARKAAEPATHSSESPVPSEWQTVTMAQLFAQQGHTDRAREIYYTILEKDPQNEDAHRGLAAINS